LLSVRLVSCPSRVLLCRSAGGSLGCAKREILLRPTGASGGRPVGCSDFGLTLTPGHDLGLYRHLRIMARSTSLCACTGEHIGSFRNDPSVVTSTVYGICTILQIAAFAASHSGLPSRAIANNAAGVRHRQPRARPSTKIIPGCPPWMSTARRKWRFAHDSSNQRV